MPGKTVYLTANPNAFEWGIADRKGTAFEDLIYLYLKRTAATRDGRVKVKRTRAVADSGRDFEVHFLGSLTLFGLEVTGSTKKRQTIFVECKSTQRDRLDDEFIVDASQHEDSEAYLYLLVTNATITPYCQFRAQQEWRLRNTYFRLIDRRRLVDELYKANMSETARRRGLTLPPSSQIPKFDRRIPVVSCQVEPEESGEAASLYLSLSNYGSDKSFSQIGIATDLQWSADRFPFERILSPGELETIRLTAQRLNYEGPADLGLSLSVNGRSHRLVVSRPDYDVVFEPPFTGKEHRKVRSQIRKIAENATSFMLLSVQGEAGVGKSRTIQEGIAPLRYGQLEVFTYNFTRHQPCPSFDNFFRMFDLSAESSSFTPAERVKDLLNKAVKADTPILIHFEDLHHADEDILKVFKRLALKPPSTMAPLIIVVTGRDDHTFPNEEYFSFLQLIKHLETDNVRSFVIQPLSDHDAKQLIRSVVVDMPTPGVERIHSLGQNNPFIIVEVLQYLLDSRLAQLLSRRTVGVLNPEVFAGRNGLPSTVEELYDLRLASLRESVNGELAIKFLTVASFFGFVIDHDVRAAFFDGEAHGEQTWVLLIQRRFVAQDSVGKQLTFAHENLLHHLRRTVRRVENAKEAGRALLGRPGLLKRLSPLDQGEVHHLTGDFPKAFACFAEIWKRVKKVTNFSSEEIHKSYFRYLPMLFDAALKEKAARKSLSRVALAYGYMGVHNYPLVLAESACALSAEMLSKIYPGPSQGLRDKLAIRQLKAHALQNMGRTGLALKEMLEIEATLSEIKQNWSELTFDLFDRLQEYYRKSNHGELCHFYGRRAKLCVKRANDERLEAAHLITHSLVHLYLSEQEARRYSREAHRVARAVGIRRFITYTRLTQLIVDAIYSRKDVERLRAISTEARSMLRDAALASFSDSIMRLELLLGTLALACYEDPEDRHSRARHYVESGQANSIRFGNGLFDWAFDNLAAVIDLEDKAKPEDYVRARFRSSMEKMRQRGLGFVGAQSGLYPNPFAISNVVRFFAQYRESDAVDVLRSTVSAYDNSFLEDEDAMRTLVTRAANGKALFWPTRRQLPVLRYPYDNGYFTPIF